MHPTIMQGRMLLVQSFHIDSFIADFWLDKAAAYV
jgi:hypothetical protein